MKKKDIDNKEDKKKKKKVSSKKKSVKEETDNKELYSTKEVVTVMLFSIGLGFLICFGLVSLLTGKNYLAVNRDLKKVVDTYYAIVDNYYGDIDKNALVDGAVSGMIEKVGDDYTTYSDSDTTLSFNETITGKYEGIGCKVATYYEDNKTVVTEVFDNSPSDKAGIKVGDIITKVDGEDYTDKNSENLANYIKNSGKSKVILTVIRDDKEKDITINLSKVEIPYVTSEIYESNGKKIGYIDISLFASTTYKQFKSNLEKLEKDNIDSLIIDVRDNNGGYLNIVTDICNLFLKKGKVIYRLEDNDNIIKKKDTTTESRDYDVAVIINANSASASEILASAIKESYGGRVVGTNSFGKGSVQQTKKLLDGSMIKYTTQKWLTPEGYYIGEIGVTPTDIVSLDEKYFDEPTTDNDNQLQEAIKILSE